MRVAVAALLLAACVSVALAGQATEQSSADETYLDALQGPWIMNGVLGGKPVVYRASGQRVLTGSWLKLRMVDASRPPQYRAEVFIGYDSRTHDYVVHWLDQFGAPGARVVATGRRDGQRLVVSFPYAEGAFRDSFTRYPAEDTWTLLLESQDQRGKWSTFASYRLARPPGR
jgi:hypothetical protein